MKFFSKNKFGTGIEISVENIILAHVCEREKVCPVVNLSCCAIAPGLIRPLFKKPHIIDENAFIYNVKKIFKKNMIDSVKIALPDICFKVFIKKFKALPEKKKEIREMVMWSISDCFSIPMEELRISWKNMGKDNENQYIFIIVLAMDIVLEQYERLFKKCGIAITMITSVGLSRYNFFAHTIPFPGNNIFLGIFHESMTVFAFSDGIPVFYKVIKKGVISDQKISTMEEMDMLLNLFLSDNPDFDIDRFFIASRVKSDHFMEQLLQEINPAEFEILNEKDVVIFDKSFRTQGQQTDLSMYIGALGVAGRN